MKRIHLSARSKLAAVAIAVAAFATPLHANQDDRMAKDMFTTVTSIEESALHDRIALALAADPALDGAAVDVIDADGTIILSGIALDPLQAAYAMEVAETLAGPSVIVAGNLQPLSLESETSVG